MKIINIDEMSCICGYFNGNTNVNNGYGCDHPEQEEYEMAYVDEDGCTWSYKDVEDTQPKKKQGKCYHFSCPLAGRCDLEDVKDYDPEEYERLLMAYNGDIDEMEAVVDSREDVVIDEETYNELIKK